MIKIEASHLYYDIPKVRGVDVFPNPSGILQRIGVRVNQSNWCLPTHRLPWNLLHRMTQAGVRWNTLEYATDTAARLEKLHNELRSAFDREVLERINSVQETANDADFVREGETERKAELRYCAAVRRAVREAAVYFGDFIQAAKGFGIRIDFKTAIGQVRAIQTVAAARARIYSKATAEMRALGLLDGLTLAAETDQLPPGVMADALRDAGKEDESQEVMDAFGLNPEWESAA